jgi:hypothetical protein
MGLLRPHPPEARRDTDRSIQALPRCHARTKPVMKITIRKARRYRARTITPVCMAQASSLGQSHWSLFFRLSPPAQKIASLKAPCSLCSRFMPGRANNSRHRAAAQTLQSFPLRFRPTFVRGVRSLRSLPLPLSLRPHIPCASITAHSMPLLSTPFTPSLADASLTKACSLRRTFKRTQDLKRTVRRLRFAVVP